MLVRLGDGREVECGSGIQRLSPGPVPEVLASERCIPVTVHSRKGHDAAAPFSVFLHARGAPDLEIG